MTFTTQDFDSNAYDTLDQVVKNHYHLAIIDPGHIMEVIFQRNEIITNDNRYDPFASAVSYPLISY